MAPIVTANELRKLVEGADGTRATNLFLVFQDGRFVLRPEEPASGTLLTIRTEFSGGPGLRSAETLSVTNGDIPRNADAAFTTQSSFEKFVLPYYVRTMTPEQLATLKKMATEDDVVCVFHEPSSETGTTITPGATGLGIVKRNGPATLIVLPPAP